MTTTTGTDLDALRARYGEAFGTRLPGHFRRLSWGAERLAACQRERLRALLACAIERSPFHARRLGGIDPERFELADLASLPVMTKEQMMAGVDELLTDRRLSRTRAEAHLMACAEEPGLLLGRYVCLASGGSSGLRGLFVQTVEEFAEFTASVLRRLVARLAAVGPPPPDGIPVALVGAASPVHASGFAAAAAAAGYPVRAISAPATLPLAGLVERLNQVRPLVVMAHTSKLALLAAEQSAGRLAIAPVSVTAMGEQLTETSRAVISDAFGIPLVNQFTCPAISVLIADDQDLVREGLRMLLQAEPGITVAGEAGTGSEAISAARKLDPDVVLMDVRMPGMDGIEAAAHLIRAGSRARILMLTTFDLDQYVYRAMRAGASGFLLKDASRDQLATAVRTVAAGEALLAPSITRRLIEDFCRRPGPDGPAAQTTRQLTTREVDVVKLVAKGLSNAEIAGRLYLSDATVKSHIARVLAKLGLRDRVQVVVLAYETGIVRPGSPG